MLASLVRLLRFAAHWALAASLPTALLSSLGRALCLPPYWPNSVVLGCRPDGLAEPLLRFPLETVLTTLMMWVPALAAGAALGLLLALLPRSAAGRAAGSVAAALLWVWLARRMEPGHLDFILGGYAIGTGALAGAWVAWRGLPPAPEPAPPQGMPHGEARG